MKKKILAPVILTFELIVLLGFGYPMLIRAIAYLAPGSGNGVVVRDKGRVVGFELVGQRFTGDGYFQGRPSAVNYNAAGSGGSNKSIFNPEYIKVMQARTDTFLLKNPGVKRNEVPVEMITSSGSGLDPDISPASARIQVPRVSRIRGIPQEKLYRLIERMTHRPAVAFFGPPTVNVLKLNVALDELR
jgi:potassium-transporting ATPase KdpC subunit